MYYSNKLFLLSTLFLLGFTSAHAMDIDAADKKSSSVPSKSRLSLVFTGEEPSYSNTYVSYKVTLEGTRKGKKDFTLAQGSSNEAEFFYSHPKTHAYIPLAQIPYTQRAGLNDERFVRRYYLSKDLDLSQFEGDIRVSVMEILESAMYLNKGKFVAKGIDEMNPINASGNIAFNTNSQSVWIIVNKDFSQAYVKIQKGKAEPKSLLSLALEQTEESIKGIRKREFSKKEIYKRLPTDVSELIRDETWEKRKEMIKKAKEKRKQKKKKSTSTA